VPFTAHLQSIVPLDHFELVCNGSVVREFRLTRSRTAADVSGTLPLRQSGWCVLRASSNHGEYPVLDKYVYATTSPVYVTVAGRRAHSGSDAKYFLAWIDRVAESTTAYPDWNSAEEKAAVLAELKAGRAQFETLQ
jgi:TolB protein